MPSVRKLRLCSNKLALQQRLEEDELSLAHLRQVSTRQYHQYCEPSMVGGTGLDMADAIGIADTINKLAASLKDIGESSECDYETMAEVQSALEKATKTLQSFSRPAAETATKEVTFYDGKAPPKSPLKSSNIRTPRRSNVSSALLQEAATSCSSPQRLLHSASTAALSCSSGYLATFGEPSPPPSPGLLEIMDEDEPECKTRRKPKKRLSLDFRDIAEDKEGKKNIQIKKGDIDIRIWGPSVGGLTLTTEGTSSTGENDSPSITPSSWVISRDQKEREETTRSKAYKTKKSDGPRFQSPDKRRLSCQIKNVEKRERVHEQGTLNTIKPFAAPLAGPINLENIVLGAMNPISTQVETPPTMFRNKKSSKTQKNKAPVDTANGQNEKHRNDLFPAMSNLSYVSGILPNQNFGEEKFKTVQTDHEKGFEVYLEGTSESSRYNSAKLRERAALNEKLLSKRREILSIQKDLEACSLLLGKFGNKTTVHTSLASIYEKKRDAPSGTKKGANAAIIRE